MWEGVCSPRRLGGAAVALGAGGESDLCCGGPGTEWPGRPSGFHSLVALPGQERLRRGHPGLSKPAPLPEPLPAWPWPLSPQSKSSAAHCVALDQSLDVSGPHPSTPKPPRNALPMFLEDTLVPKPLPDLGSGGARAGVGGVAWGAALAGRTAGLPIHLASACHVPSDPGGGWQPVS